MKRFYKELNNLSKGKKFKISEIEPKYYGDGEDAYAMRRDLVEFSILHDISPAHSESFFSMRTSGGGDDHHYNDN